VPNSRKFFCARMVIVIECVIFFRRRFGLASHPGAAEARRVLALGDPAGCECRDSSVVLVHESDEVGICSRTLLSSSRRNRSSVPASGDRGMRRSRRNSCNAFNVSGWYRYSELRETEARRHSSVTVGIRSSSSLSCQSHQGHTLSVQRGLALSLLAGAIDGIARQRVLR